MPGDRSAGGGVPLFVLWTSFLSSAAVLGVVGAMLAPEVAASPSPYLTPTLALVALLLAGATVVLRPVLARSGTYQGYCVVRWALCEAIGVLGLVVYLTTGASAVFAGFLGLSALMFLVNAPLDFDRRAWERITGGSSPR